MTEVQQYHECSIDQERVAIIADKYRELLNYNMRYGVMLDSVKTYYTQQIQKFMSAENQRFDIEVAFPCDIDLEWYLVPKAWVREIVQKIIVS